MNDAPKIISVKDGLVEWIMPDAVLVVHNKVVKLGDPWPVEKGDRCRICSEISWSWAGCGEFRVCDPCYRNRVSPEERVKINDSFPKWDGWGRDLPGR